MSDSHVDVEGFAGFLVGAGLGAALARWFVDSGRASALADGSNLSDTHGPHMVAADVGRLHALLGEIKGLLGPRAGGPGEARTGPDGPAGRERPGALERTGYGILRGRPENLVLPALCAAVAGAAYGAFRKGVAAEALPAMAGFLAAGAWTALRGHFRPAGSRRLGPAGPWPETRGSRTNRPAMP